MVRDLAMWSIEARRYRRAMVTAVALLGSCSSRSAVRKSLTTPIVLTDGKVVGWGEEALARISQ